MLPHWRVPGFWHVRITVFARRPIQSIQPFDSNFGQPPPMTALTQTLPDEKGLPDIKVSVRQTFGLDTDMQVPGFSKAGEHVPDIDEAYRFDHDTTLAILAGFAHNRRVIIQGYHGTD